MKQFAFLGATMLLIGAGCSLNSTPSISPTTSIDVPVSLESEIVVTEATSTDTSIIAPLTSEYTIATGVASYIAQKEFFSKPTEAITGTTRDVTGRITIDQSSRTFSLTARIANTFVTNSDKRDAVIENMLTGPILITANNTAYPEELITLNKTTFPGVLNLTIANTAKDVPFSITVERTSNGIIATGKATISVKDFNLEAPSLLNVYTVHDSIDITFDIGTSS